MKKVLVEKQAAALLEVSVKCMQGWRYRGGGPLFAKMGRLIRYLESDLEAFILEKRRTSTSDRGQTTVYSPPPGITIRPLPEHERTLDRRPVAAYPIPVSPRPVSGSPTRRRHIVHRGRVLIRFVPLKQHITESAPRPAR